MVVVEIHWHAVVGEHQEGQGAGPNLVFGDQMADHGLKERLVRDPGRAEIPHHVAAVAGEVQKRFNRAAAQAPPLAANLHLDVGRHLARQTEPPLEVHRGVKQLLVRALIKEVAVDQPVVLDAGLDPVSVEEIETLDEIHLFAVEKPVGKLGGLGRHAVTRQHVEMRGARKSIDRRLDRQQGGVH